MGLGTHRSGNRAAPGEAGPTALTRRRFLADALALSAVGGASAVGLGGCGGATSTSARPRPAAALARLARQIKGRILVSGSPGYDPARLGFNSVYDGVRPLAIVQAAGVDDVV